MRCFIVLFCLPLAAFAEEGHDDHADGLDDAPLQVESAEDLRELAEIDGDPATFTQDEQVKFLLLGQLLGVEAALPVSE